jgi:2-dehydropantoate 2-reductase
MTDSGIFNVCVYGTGGVGGYFGTRLILANDPNVRVSLISRNEGLAAIRSNGLILTSPDGQRNAAQPFMLTDNVGEVPAPDLVLLCVKEYDLDGAIAALAPVVGENTVIIPLLNGVDIYDRVRAGLPRGIVLPATVTVSVHLTAPGEVTHASGQGLIITGPDARYPVAKPDKMLDVFQRAGLPVEWRDNPLGAIWTKFIFIAPFGLVTSAYDETIGEVLAEPDKAEQARQIMREIKELADRRHIDLPADIIEATFDRARAFPFDTKTSLQRDVEQPGKRNELGLFGGSIVKMGKTMGIRTPATERALKAAGNRR